MKIKYLSLTVLFLVILSSVNAQTKMTDEQSNRAIDLYKETRCLVCQGQTIYDSNSELATDLKLYIQEEIVATISSWIYSFKSVASSELES